MPRRHIGLKSLMVRMCWVQKFDVGAEFGGLEGFSLMVPGLQSLVSGEVWFVFGSGIGWRLGKYKGHKGSCQEYLQLTRHVYADKNSSRRL